MKSPYARGLAAVHRRLVLLFTRAHQVKRAFQSSSRTDPHREFWNHWQGVEVPADGPGEEKRELLFPSPPVDVLGLYLASVIPWAIPEEAVRQMLPGRLEPGPHGVTPPGQHPVLLLFGHQRHVRPNSMDIAGMEYLEFLIAIPYVQWKKPANRYRGPFVFMPRLFLDEVLPVVLGWVCGYAKWPARVQATITSYQIHSLVSNVPLIEGSFVPKGSPRRTADFSGFEPLRGMFKQPILGQTLLGPFVCTYFNFELERAKMQALEARIQVNRAFVPGLPVQPFQVRGIDEAPLGAFRWIIPWTLTPPFEPYLVQSKEVG